MAGSSPAMTNREVRESTKMDHTLAKKEAYTKRGLPSAGDMLRRAAGCGLRVPVGCCAS